MLVEIKNNFVEDLEDITQHSVPEYCSNYGRNYTVPLQYRRPKKVSCINACASRSKTVVEVWTPQQKEMLARVDEIINRPIK